ncbi:MAG: MaoC family dehydratase [Rhodothermaceae bacterium]|nr:MaoC family dehydratase [Rhodothermaceae bacterium]
MPDAAYTFATVAAFVGHELGVSDWITVDQPMINAFAEVTGDQQWIHVDTDRAAREAPGGTTIAHGLLTLSLLPRMRNQTGVIPEGTGRSINYGYDKIRFLAPVPPGSRIRARIELTDAVARGDGFLVTTRNTVEIGGEEKPAMIVDSLTLLLPA